MNNCPGCLNENVWCFEHQKEQLELERKGYSSLEINKMMREKEEI